MDRSSEERTSNARVLESRLLYGEDDEYSLRLMQAMQLCDFDEMEHGILPNGHPNVGGRHRYAICYGKVDGSFGAGANV